MLKNARTRSRVNSCVCTMAKNKYRTATILQLLERIKLLFVYNCSQQEEYMKSLSPREAASIAGKAPNTIYQALYRCPELRDPNNERRIREDVAKRWGKGEKPMGIALSIRHGATK